MVNTHLFWFKYMGRPAAKKQEKPQKAEAVQDTFGFRKTAPDARTGLVREVFEAVAPHYDVMNDLMSLGIHRLWKRDFVADIEPTADDSILDLAGGTGDIAFLMEEFRTRSGRAPKHKMTICDINPAMLAVGKKRSVDRGLHGAFDWVEGNAEELPFPNNSFDVVTISFGLRNVTHLSKALSEIHRVLKAGGRFYCLEFSHVAVPALQKIYDKYSFSILPFLGEKVAGNRAAYQYLAESIRAFPAQDKLVKLMEAAGFKNARYKNIAFGVAAQHTGLKV